MWFAGGLNAAVWVPVLVGLLQMAAGLRSCLVAVCAAVCWTVFCCTWCCLVCWVFGGCVGGVAGLWGMRVSWYREGDEWGIVELYNLCYSRWRSPFLVRSPESWRWCYLDQPLAEREGVLLAEDEGRVVSTCIVSLRRVWAPWGVSLVGVV